jgi:hypothetical protein
MTPKPYALYENNIFIDRGTSKHLNIIQNTIRSSIIHRRKATKPTRKLSFTGLKMMSYKKVDGKE